LDKLDPALLRPGRFDRQIFVSPPDLKGRLEILDVHTKTKPLHQVDLHVVARQTAGLTGADLANICNEAAIFAGRHRRDVVLMQDFDAALERTVAGMQSRRVMNDHEKRVIAYHEAGHALCAELLPSQDKTHRVSIVPRGHALGYTLHLPEEDRYLKTREEMVDWMVVALGGRVAEHIVFGDVTTGASNDLAKVYEISRKMVAEYGMGTQISSRRMPADDYSVSEATRRMVDEEQQELTDLAQRRARRLIEGNREALEVIAAELLAHEVLERETIERIMAAHRSGEPTVTQLPTGTESRIAAAERLEP
ncbi:MAG: cell division protease FtsH, partial [Thermoleophilaceae bacterium]|nr:cell division protease FtsH [Thermoleophilaceae bacterium]